MTFAQKDHVAAVGDMIAFDGELIEINGNKVKAHIERGELSLEKSEFGLDNREELLTATIINRGSPTNVKDAVKYKGKPYRITEIDQGNGSIEIISLEND